MKNKLKPGLSGLSPALQFVAAKAIATVSPIMGNFARQMDAESALQEAPNANCNPQATPGSK